MTFFAAESFFQGMARWDFGLDSPNKAAAVLVFLLLPLLALSVRARREKMKRIAAEKQRARAEMGRTGAIPAVKAPRKRKRKA